MQGSPALGAPMREVAQLYADLDALERAYRRGHSAIGRERMARDIEKVRAQLNRLTFGGRTPVRRKVSRKRRKRSVQTIVVA